MANESSTTATIAEMGIPMRDGVELAADVYFPEQSALPAPVILTMTPYDKRNLVGDEAKYYQSRGYVSVSVDCRGRGKSEGEWRAAVNDGKDGHDAVEWLAAQTWSTGKVGTTGLSYLGWFQWATAAERPKHLTCMISTSAAGRWQQEIPYTNGCFQLYCAWWVYMVRRRITEFYGLSQYDWDTVLRMLPLESIGALINPSGLTWRDFMDHDTLDDHWKSVRYDDRYHEIDYPCLHVTGWFDLEDLLGAFHHYEHMIAASPAKEHQRLIAGPWSHMNSRHPKRVYAGIDFGEAAAPDMDAIHLRWFDYWLKGIDNGALDEPKVKLWRGGANEWLSADHWPLSSTTRSLFLSGESLVDKDPKAGSREYRYDPNDPVLTGIDVKKYPEEDAPIVLNGIEARSDVLVYSTEPLNEPLEISGWPHLELNASSDCDDTEWHVRIADVAPDGTSVKVCQGCLRASHRDSLERPTPLTPGETHRFDIEFWPVHYVFQPGHRIRLLITSSDFPWFARSLNQFGPIKDQSEIKIATNTVLHGGAGPSRLVLPVNG